MRHQIEIIGIIFSHLAVIYKLIPNANFQRNYLLKMPKVEKITCSLMLEIIWNLK
jgi:hypothetical protein